MHTNIIKKTFFLEVPGDFHLTLRLPAGHSLYRKESKKKTKVYIVKFLFACCLVLLFQNHIAP